MIHIYSGPMPAKALKELLQAKRKRDYLWFPEVRDGLPLLPSEIKYVVRRWCREYDVVTLSPYVIHYAMESVLEGFWAPEDVLLMWVTDKGARKVRVNERGQPIDPWPSELRYVGASI